MFSVFLAKLCLFLLLNHFSVKKARVIGVENIETYVSFSSTVNKPTWSRDFDILYNQYDILHFAGIFTLYLKFNIATIEIVKS